MNLEQLTKEMETATGAGYLKAVELATKPQFKFANLWPEPKRYFNAFMESYKSQKIAKIKPLKIEEQNLEKLLFPFASKDELRPVMQGIFINNEEIVSTDAHKLAILPNFLGYHLNGIWRFNKIAKEPTTDTLIPYSDSRYPDYQSVIPRNYTDIKAVELEKLRQILTAAKKHKLYQFTENKGNKVIFEINNTVYCVNGNFLLDCVTLFLQLNCETCLANFSGNSRAIVFKWGRITVLLMPVYFEDKEDIGLMLDLTDCFY